MEGGGEDSDVQLDDEWEAVAPAAPAAAASPASAGDITIYLGREQEQDAAAGSKPKRTGRSYTKAEREEALLVHRTHSLCLLAHAVLHDQAACSSELQALLLSLLPAKLLEAAAAAAAAEDPSPDAWLPGVLRWFNRTFTLVQQTQQLQQQRQQRRQTGAAGAAAGPSSRAPEPRQHAGDAWQQEVLGLGLAAAPLQQQLQACVAARCSSAPQLATLLTALLRGLGFLTRSVWSLDGLPFKPAAVEALQRGKSIRVTTRRAGAAAAAGAGAGHCGRPPLPGAGSRARGRGRGKGRGRGRARSGNGSGKAKAAAGSKAAGKKRKAPAGSADAGSDSSGGNTSSSEDDEARDPSFAAPGAAAAGAAPGRGRKRRAPAAEQQQPRQEHAPGSPAAAQAAADQPAASSNGTLGGSAQAALASAGAAAGAAELADAALEQHSSKRTRKRKGDEEFELQLAMAMASTAAEAEGRAAAAATTATAAAAAGAGSASRGSPGAQPPLSQPARPGRALAEAASAGGTALPRKSPGKQAGGSLAGLINKEASPTALKAAATAAKPPAGWLWQPQPGAAAPKVWAEVYLGSSASGRWLHVDGLLGCWDQAGVVEASVARQQPLSYVVAVQEGAPKDVTRRYAANFTVTSRWRDGSWWDETMRALASTAAHLPRALAVQMAAATASGGAGGGVVAAAAAADAPPGQLQPQGQEQQPPPQKRRRRAQPRPAEAAQEQDADALRASREDAELSARAAQQVAGPPTSLEGFKSHPLYVLQRHLTKYQGLVPGAAKLGLHKGEAYYARADVQELASVERWELQWRRVKPEELGKPAKVVNKRKQPDPPAGGRGGRGGRGGWGAWRRSSGGGSDSEGDPAAAPPAAAAAAAAAADGSASAEAAEAADGAGEPAAAETTVRLYGRWQTEEHIPCAVDGKVPRGERGNVAVPPHSKAVPQGCAWLDAPNLAPICRSLGIDYAPALAGFDRQGGRWVPSIRGVVVCEEFEQAVLERYYSREAEKQAAAQDQARREALAAWRRLLQHLWLRLELTRKYGGGAAAADGAAGAPARAPAGSDDAAAGAAAGAPDGSGGAPAARRAAEIIGSLNAAGGAAAVGGAAAAAADAGAGAERGSAPAAGQQAARADGGRTAAGRRSRALPPGVALGSLVAGAGPAPAAAAATADHAAAGGGSPPPAGGEQQQDEAAGPPAAAGREGVMEGVEVEEF